MAKLLPLFPLQLVAFPGSAIPLHIFEDRYKEMVGEAEAGGSEFGIVLAREEGIVNAGCTVVVEKVPQRYPDGRFDVIARGQRRFEILAINQDKDYLRGEVRFFDDEDSEPASAELRTRALEALKKINAALPESQHPPADVDHPRLSFQLAQVLEDVDFQNMLQRSRSEAERLRMFAEFAEIYISRRVYAAKMKRAAPLNGSGHAPAGLS